MTEHWLITGGCGFIGSNFVRWVFRNRPEVRVTNLDKLTYAGNPANLAEFDGDPRYRFVKGDICDPEIVEAIMAEHIDVLVNFAAETHVDRSLTERDAFIRTDVLGVNVLLDLSLKHKTGRIIQISTDEVYGSCDGTPFTEESLLQPSNPYSASKAGGDLLARAYARNFGMPVIVTRCSNNYGPYQYPEKIAPLFITNAMEDKPLPLYGDGRQTREWIHVEDHCSAIGFLIECGIDGETYNLTSDCAMENIEFTKYILKALNKPESLIKPVKDRLGHDRRYAIKADKIKRLGWRPRYSFDEGMRSTIDWYVNNRAWWDPIKSGAFREYYRKNYGFDL